MFQFPAFAPVIITGDGIAPAGLPHSEIRGSTGICPSPRLIAACHVLLRLREPRHPPCALRLFCYFLTSLPKYIVTPVFSTGRLSCFRQFYLTALVVSFEFLLCLLADPLIRVSLPSCQCALFWVENNGVEPLTLCLQSRCSSQLS